ncbi:MAG: DUF4430 domain-containing protein [Bacteroidales bacterium]|nr:DUF4430 domain-containing protein [Bacteroidales bacterium]
MKKILFFLLVLASFNFVAKAQQPQDASISADDIIYWVGNGSNRVVFSVTWADYAFAWGYRFSEDSVSVRTIVDSIAANDWRFSYIGESYISDFVYAGDDELYVDTLRLTTDYPADFPDYVYFQLQVNHQYSMVGADDAMVTNGDFVKFADTYAGVAIDSALEYGYMTYTYVWPQTIYPVTLPVDPEDVTINPDDILYWVGTGSNEIVMAINWAVPDTCLAWGVRFNGSSITNAQALNSIALADPRFSYSGDYLLDELFFVTDSNDTLRLTANSYWSNNVNGNQSAGINAALHDGDFSKWGDIAVGIGYDYFDWGTPEEPMLYPMGMAWLTPVFPVSVPQTTPELPDDATISADNIMYWVGNGENEVVFVVNFCNPEAEALAWGVRFSGESAIVSDIFHTIELYDERFAVEGTSFVTNITFADGIHDNYTTSMYWMYNVNGVTAANYADQQEVHHGDIIKFGDADCGIITDSVMYTYVWTTPVVPVELPSLSTEVFDGVVGTEGCKAIKYDDPAILGWATSCVVTRGYQNIANGEGSSVASFGTDADGVGPASLVSDDGVVSLGDAGTAVLTFGMPITNGEGYDFAVFENSLNNTFLEQAFVEVSSDGEHFYRFPSVSNTQTDQQIGNGGAVDATKLHNLAGKYIIGYGTPFDLEELAGYSNLDINNVTHVRLVDVVGSINPLYGTTDKNGHLINDPYPTPFNSGGFDLGGVAVMNGWTPAAVNNYQQKNSFVAYPNPCQNVLNVSNATVNEPVSLFNTMGQLIWDGMTQNAHFQLDMQSYPAGVYMLQIGSQITKVVKK